MRKIKGRFFDIDGKNIPCNITGIVCDKRLSKIKFEKNDFIYVKDAAKMLLKPLLLKVPSGIYNIGTGKIISVLEICRVIEKKFFMDV